jgi:GNAT superfamily N-acetyltransferase
MILLKQNKGNNKYGLYHKIRYFSYYFAAIVDLVLAIESTMSTAQLPQSDKPLYTISPAQTPADIDAVRILIQTYSHTQVPKQQITLAAESVSLPGRFSSPHGAMLLARTTTPEQIPIGWIGLRPFPELSDPQNLVRNRDVCQAKRLFVLEEYRGLGIGKALVQAVAKTAREKGYKQVKISVETHLKKEIEMYKRWGFVEMEKYCEMPELVFLALEL